MNEAETRAEHIDPALAQAGWGVVEGSRIRREYPITQGRLEGAGKRGTALTADYVLEYRGTKLAVVEAKAWDKPLTEGVGQAKVYAKKLDVRFTYATNGQGVYGIDRRTGKEGERQGFPTPQELWQATFATENAWRNRFAAVPYEDKGGAFPGRYYQDLAVEKVLEAVSQGRDRVLLTLATGTGKTFIAFQIAWKLFHSRWNLADWRAGREPSRRPRILFLADRNILANQAFSDFSAFPEDALVRIAADEIRKKGKVPKNGSVFFTIFQTFMTKGAQEEGEDVEESEPVHGSTGSPRTEDAGAPRTEAHSVRPELVEGREPVTEFVFGDYSPDFFDLVIVDECHRGGAKDESAWRGILEHFKPAVQLGLTATPKRTLNADTYAYFGDPVFTYSLKDGINDGFLTPFRVKQISTTLDEYRFSPDDVVVEGEIDTARIYGEAAFNKEIRIAEREKARVRIFLEEIDQREKTLVFCATQPHALDVRDFVNQLKKSSDPDYCHRVTAQDGALGEQWLRTFQDNEKTIPTILTTSQKLSTGVNARNVRNIVLLRPVNSMIEFKQIIGRGTRLFDGKDYFTIYDFVKAHEHFADPEWDGEPMEPAPAKPRVPREPPVLSDPYEVQEPPSETPRKEAVVVRLGAGKERRIQHMMATSFWHPDGTPMSSAQFLEQLFGHLPALFRDEAQLRELWSLPDTRRKLLEALAERGFGMEQLAEMQRLLEAERSDLYDVLAYVAFAEAPHTRAERAGHAKGALRTLFNPQQRAFLEFVLSHYESLGVEELAEPKLSPLLKLRYGNALADAFLELGPPDEVRRMFVGFQKHLYDLAA